MIEGRTYYVGERGSATYTAARGEIPYRLVPRSTFWFADLSDGAGGLRRVDGRQEAVNCPGRYDT